MWTTFVVNLKRNLRDRSALFWLIVFPIALSTMFNGMFGGLGEHYELRAMPLAVVQDANWRNASGAQSFVNALSADADTDASSASASSASASSASAGAAGAASVPTLVEASAVESVDAARTLITEGAAKGYLTVDGGGRLALTLSTATVNGMQGPGGSDANDAITAAALGSAIDLYNRTDAAIRAIIEENPRAVASRAFWSSLGAAMGATREVQLTNFRPDVTARYYYALLGMSCLMAMGYAVSAVTLTQANLSPLGLRRTVAPVGRGVQLIAGFLASWLCSALSLTVALAYIRYACGIALGGREPAALLAVVVGSFMACALGTMIGAIPKMPDGAKHGLASGIACTLSLFSGLYGQFAMSLSDWIARNAPVLAAINPAQQVTDLFYDILYYDGYRPFIATCLRLLAMSVAFLAVGVLMLRRQRHDYL